MPSSPLTNPGSERRQPSKNQPIRSTNIQEPIANTNHTGGGNIPSQGLHRRDSHGDRARRIYPGEITKPPSRQFPSGTQEPNSPTFKPVYPSNGSPLLTAFGSTKGHALQYTSEWAKSLPFTSVSPPRNGLSIAGSPPGRYVVQVGHDGGLPRTPPFASSPPFQTRLLEKRDQRANMGGHLQASPGQQPARRRRQSMMSDASRVPFGLSPPPPHLAQAHFYGAPELDFGVPPTHSEGIRAGEHGYYCGFDTLRTCGDHTSASAENVLLMGFEGGLEVLRIEKEKADVIGRIDGLMGGVLGAKILPCTLRHDPFMASRPLVGLIIHGPIIDETKRDLNLNDADSLAEADVPDTNTSSCGSRPSSPEGLPPANITHYQTTVQVYSLKTACHIATLFKCPPIPISDGAGLGSFSQPPPSGDLKIAANGKFIVVSSGCSGEVFLFALSAEDIEGFRCIGKLWAAVQTFPRRPMSVSSTSTESYISGDDNGLFRAPLFALSNRWLATSAPAASRLSSLNGTVLLSTHHKKPPGLNTHSAPPQPSPNCTTETMDGKSLLNRVARGVTQEFIKGALWVGDQGMQAFRAYWNRPVNGQPTNSGVVLDFAAQQAQYFPPTHGQNGGEAATHDEAAVISIYDLQKLLDPEAEKSKHSFGPVATFQLLLGCSFLSFSPNGLSLLTVSKKGDVHSVWDLMEVVCGRANAVLSSTASAVASLDANGGRRVREVALFTRMTVANVVDAFWTTPKGDRLAILTAKGTVHIYDIPKGAFQWPPRRRTSVMDTNTTQHKEIGTPGADPASAAQSASESKSISTSALTSAMQALSTKDAPLISTFRRRGENNGLRFPTFSTLDIAPTASAVGAKGGKAVAAGLGKGLNAAAHGVNSLRQARDNKIYIHALSSGVVPDCVRWLTGREVGCIAIAAGGAVRVYSLKRDYGNSSGNSQSKRTTQLPRTIIAKGKSVEYTLPLIADDPVAPAALEYLEAQTSVQRAKIKPIGFWTLKTLPTGGAQPQTQPGRRRYSSNVGAAHPLSFVEIDTTAAYQPFHADRRISLFALTEGSEGSRSTGIELMGEPWVFGQDIPAVKIRVVPSPAESAALGHGMRGDEDVCGKESDDVGDVGWKRRKGKGVGVGRGEDVDEDGFFEDDCEVLESDAG